MVEVSEIQPLPRRRRRYTFLFLVAIFISSLPFLFLYATGYRLNLDGEGPFVSTGGIYISVDRTGAEIYIDDELVRETRTFRTAFYAQGLEPGVHRVHVQKLDHHTWVKELPVYAYLVTEALAFNLPEVPTVRIISPWRTNTGETVVSANPVIQATTTSEFIVSTRVPPSFVADTEYATLLQLFATSTSTSAQVTPIERVASGITSFLDDTATTTATTTKIANGVQLFESEGDVYAKWIDSREQMPYYYCAEEFELTTSQTPDEEVEESYEAGFIGPVQYVPTDVVCEPVIKLDRGDEEVSSFDFFPGSTDLVLLARSSGVYAVEIDDRAWQNVQPLMLGAGLDMRVENGNVYLYDGVLIYQVLIDN